MCDMLVGFQLGLGHVGPEALDRLIDWVDLGWLVWVGLGPEALD